MEVAYQPSGSLWHDTNLGHCCIARLGCLMGPEQHAQEIGGASENGERNQQRNARCVVSTKPRVQNVEGGTRREHGGTK